MYDRMTIFEDHMIRDINAGRFADNTSIVLVTHGLALRVFLMRWFHWSVDQFLDVYNPPNAEVCQRPYFCVSNCLSGQTLGKKLCLDTAQYTYNVSELGNRKFLFQRRAHEHLSIGVVSALHWSHLH